MRYLLSLFFFFNDTATTEIYTLSLHDALPICSNSATHNLPRSMAEIDLKAVPAFANGVRTPATMATRRPFPNVADRKSTRLNSSHQIISYAVFCLKKKKNQVTTAQMICSTSRH